MNIAFSQSAELILV